jgi:predicted AAA+ superfamily ATPase
MLKEKNENGEIVEKRYEIDFMFQNSFKNYAIEVKSTKRFTTKSFDALKEKYKQIKFEKYVASPKTYNLKDNQLNIPIYMIPFIMDK